MVTERNSNSLVNPHCTDVVASTAAAVVMYMYFLPVLDHFFLQGIITTVASQSVFECI